MQKTVLVLLFCLLIVITSSEQTRDTPTATFKATTELVLVPATVVDRSGKHIAGLSRNDFAILQDDHEIKIAYFEEVKATASQTTQTSGTQMPKDVFTNHLNDRQSAAHLTIIAIDLANSPFLSQAVARRTVLESLAKLPDDGDPKALVVFTKSGMKVLHDFTNDPQALSRAVRRIVLKPADLPEGPDPIDSSVGESVFEKLSDFTSWKSFQYNEFQQRMLIEQTNTCFRQIAVAFSGVPGRKTLIWATAGAPMFLMTPMETGADHATYVNMSMESVPEYVRTWRMLNAANVAVYPIDVREPYIPNFNDASVKGFPTAQSEQWNRAGREGDTAAMVNMAQETGGTACIERNDPTGCFREAVEDSKSYYMLGFYLDKNAKPGWHQLHVKTVARHATVRARSGFEVPSPEAQPGRQPNVVEILKAAMISPLDYTEVPMTARWTEVENGKNGKNLANFELKLAAGGFQIDPDDGNHINLELSIVLRKNNGDAIPVTVQNLEARLKPQSAAQIRRDGFVYRNKIDIDSGDHVVRFIVRDKLTGRMGSVSAPLTVAQGKVQKGN